MDDAGHLARAIAYLMGANSDISQATLTIGSTLDDNTEIENKLRLAVEAVDQATNKTLAAVEGFTRGDEALFAISNTAKAIGEAFAAANSVHVALVDAQAAAAAAITALEQLAASI